MTTPNERTINRLKNIHSIKARAKSNYDLARTHDRNPKMDKCFCGTTYNSNHGGNCPNCLERDIKAAKS